MAHALSHLRVVELCDDIPGAACARQFAAWGADVLVIEPPGGAPLRRLPPLAPDGDGQPASLLWEYLGANKRSATLDPDDETAPEDLRAVIQQADVFVTDRSPQWLTAAGLDYSALSAQAPGVVMVAVSPFGADGPYAGYAASDLVVQALSGMVSLSGEPERTPLKVAANVLPHACGVSAFIGALAALHERETSGRGQMVEVACAEAVASLVLFLRAQYFGAPFPRRSGVGTVLVRCADGYVLCNPRALRAWDDLLAALGLEPEAVPESLRTPESRQDTVALLRFLEALTRGRPTKDLFHALGALTVAGMLETPTQLLDDDHLRARGYFRTLAHPRLGNLTFPGPAGRMSETPMVSPAPAPAKSEVESRNAEFRMDSDVRRSDFRPRRERSERVPRSEAPLADIRVLDLTTAWIGPYAGMLLADLGADVIKIEAPRRPDAWRFFYAPGAAGLGPPPVARRGSHRGNTSFYYNAVNRNKRSLALDLASERGKQLFLRLVRSADIVLENFTPRVLDNFGLGYEVLRTANPGLILVSWSGYGRTGPYRDIKATGATIETIAGWVSLFGYPGEPPMLMGEMEADPASGLQAAAHALVALAYRDRTGIGQRVDGSMFEAAVGYIGEEIVLASLGIDLPHPRGNRDRALAPQGVFPCNDAHATMNDGARPSAIPGHASSYIPLPADEWIAITVRDDRDWQALLAVAENAPWLREPRFATSAGRLAAVDELEEQVGRWTRTHAAGELMAALQRAGVPAGVVLKTDEVPHDPHVVARGWFRPLTHPDTGTHLHNGHPWRFSRSPLVWRSASPRLGQHSAEILHDELRLDEPEFDELFDQGVTTCVEDSGPEAVSGA